MNFYILFIIAIKCYLLYPWSSIFVIFHFHSLKSRKASARKWKFLLREGLYQNSFEYQGCGVGVGVGRNRWILGGWSWSQTSSKFRSRSRSRTPRNSRNRSRMRSRRILAGVGLGVGGFWVFGVGVGQKSSDSTILVTMNILEDVLGKIPLYDIVNKTFEWLAIERRIFFFYYSNSKFFSTSKKPQVISTQTPRTHLSGCSFSQVQCGNVQHLYRTVQWLHFSHYFQALELCFCWCFPWFL